MRVFQGTPGTPSPPGPWLEYRKIATVYAFQVEEDFMVQTAEGEMIGKAGDYLCQGPAGERWPVRSDIFEATYQLVLTTTRNSSPEADAK